MTKEEKEAILTASGNAVLAGEKFIDAIKYMHKLTKDYSPAEVQDIVDHDEDFQKAQADMDNLYEKFIELGLF